MMQEQIRKYQDHLAVSGGGVIIFGLWSLIKTLVYYFTAWKGGPGTIASEIESYPEAKTVTIVVTVIMLIIVLGLDIGLRLIVGLNARAEGHGKKKSLAYVILAMILAAFTLFFFVIYGYGVFSGQSERGIFDIIITAIVDITSLAAFLDVIISSLKLRRINRTADIPEVV